MTSQKIYRKIKRSGFAVSLVLFLILFVLTVGVVIGSGYEFATYVIDTKLTAGYDTASYLKGIYETGVSSGTDPATLYRMLDSTGHDYLVTDASGSILHINGRDTRNKTQQAARLAANLQDISVYTDSELPYIYPDKHGELTVELRAFRDLLKDDSRFSVDFDSDEAEPEEEVDEEEDEGFFSVRISMDSIKDERFIPFWISFDIAPANEKLIIKTWFTASVNDIKLLVIVSGALITLILVILIYSLISIIRSFRRQKRIINYFFTDPVTGGHNWMWYQIKGDQLLKRWRNRNNTYAIVSLSLINFRTYCICHSVADGDRLLQRIDAVIRLNISKKEMCAHNGSSTFALILQYENIEALKQRLNMLILNLEIIEPGHKFSYQAGVSPVDIMLDKNGKPRSRRSISLQHEYNNASTAKATLFDSDDSGIAFFDEKIVEDQKWLDSVQQKQAQAIANEEFAVYYQPKYDPRTNELRGAEALIRWQSPDFGFVAPYKFIPIFEKNGFITEIDHYMLTHVARDQRSWLDAGYRCVPVSVNVSRAHFIENDLAEQIRDIVDNAGCPHNLIEIELTESAFFDDKKAMIETINKLKSYGFAVSMDDFGAGYSSLNSLKDMPLDVLKLDADFFRGESADGRGEIVVSEAIRLAKSLNMRIVAEGVEIREQVDFLAGEGCDMIQGYYFAKPMPGGDYEQRMRQVIAEVETEAAEDTFTDDRDPDTPAPDDNTDNV